MGENHADPGNGAREAIKIVIADDHPPTRAGIRMALEDQGFEIQAEAGNAKSAVDGVAEHRPDVCLLDIHMPGGGITAAAEISDRFPETAVVMLTVSDDDADLFAALLAGASGYLLKDIHPERLPAALKGALAGEAALPRRLTAHLVEEFRARDGRGRLSKVRGQQVKLTSREWETLQLMREGLSTKEIAERLFISKVTVRTHISTILKKLKVTDRQEAIDLFENR